jgi:chemotaxis protein MotB
VAGNKAQSLNDPVAKAAQMPDPASTVTQQQVAQLANAMSQAQVKGEVSNLKQAQAQLQKALQVAGLAKGVTFRFDERGLVASIATDKVAFASGSATLLPAGRRILDVLAPTLLRLPNQLSIDGHTDSSPISTARFPSNWELGSARADGVLRYLASAHHIPFDRMSSSSFADTQPIQTGHSAAAMAADRRVEIVVLARIDNSAGRAVAQLGNSSTTASATPSPTSNATPSPAQSTTGSAMPTPAHNLLGPDPTTSSGTTSSGSTKPTATR